MRTADYFPSRADATRAARQFIWGDVPFARRAFIDPKNSPDLAFYDHRGFPVLAVTAQVNNDLVVLYFDHYGRQTSLVVLPR